MALVNVNGQLDNLRTRDRFSAFLLADLFTMVSTVRRPRPGTLPAWHSRSCALGSPGSAGFLLCKCVVVFFFLSPSSHLRMKQFLRGCLQLPPPFLGSLLTESPPRWPSCPPRSSSEPHVCLSPPFQTPPPGRPTGESTPSLTFSPTERPLPHSAQHPALLPGCHRVLYHSARPLPARTGQSPSGISGVISPPSLPPPHIPLPYPLPSWGSSPTPFPTSSTDTVTFQKPLWSHPFSAQRPSTDLHHLAN